MLPYSIKFAGVFLMFGLLLSEFLNVDFQVKNFEILKKNMVENIKNKIR